jgi:hypothetical protein
VFAKLKRLILRVALPCVLGYLVVVLITTTSSAQRDGRKVPSSIQRPRVTESFRVAGLRYVIACYNKEYSGPDENGIELADRLMMDAMNGADIQRRTRADDEMFSYLHATMFVSDMASFEWQKEHNKVAEMKTGRSDADSTGPEERYWIRLAEVCQREAEQSLRRGHLSSPAACYEGYKQRVGPPPTVALTLSEFR